MRKKVFGRKLSRGRKAREALFSSLVSSLIVNGKVVTTKAKAKAIRGVIESYLSLVKKGSLSVRRRILAELRNNNEAVKTLFNKKFVSVKIINLPRRKGDNAEISRMELIEEKIKESKSKNENVSTKTKGS